MACRYRIGAAHMLHHLNDCRDRRRITLIWSNRTREHLFGADELDAMTRNLTSFQWIPIFTRNGNTAALSGRLDAHKLDSMLKNCDRNATVYLCGPPEMIVQVRRQLLQVGFSKATIKYEAFNL